MSKKGYEYENVKTWIVDLDALLMSPEIVRDYDVKIPYGVLSKYDEREEHVAKKDIVLQEIKRDKRKVIHGLSDNFLDLNKTDYGLITGNLSKLANTDLERPVLTPADKMKVGYTGVEYFDVNDEEIHKYIEEGIFNGHSGQFVHDFGLNENQYIILGNSLTYSHTKYYIVKNGYLEEINYDSNVIKGVAKQKVTPRNDRQRLAMDLLGRREVPLKLITGVYGAGKSLAPFHS